MTTAQILRDHRRRDILASIEEWRHATGWERRQWRADALYLLRQWRARYRNPERAAFQQAVARSRA